VYVPRFNAVDDEAEVRRMVAIARTGWLVTVGVDGAPAATLLPIMWEGSSIIAHMARANTQWRAIDPGGPALLIVAGPDAYISPTWYPAKAEHGRVVPTWNYTAVHFTGTARVRHEASWVLRAVSELTEVHEGSRRERWRITDAPPDFIDTQLRAIVGIELEIDHVEAKAKLSQNRSDADRLGVIAGLGDESDSGAHAIAAAMQQRENHQPR
jgi:transcriptional regulator